MGKVSTKLEEFTDTYSTILSGIHNDMMKYRKEVKQVREENQNIEKSVLKSYQEIQHIERSNSQTKEEISLLFLETKKYYNKIQTTVDETKELKKNIESTKINIENQHQKLQPELEKVGLEIEGLIKRHKKFEDQMVQKEEKIKLLQYLFYGLSFLVVLILILTIFLG